MNCFVGFDTSNYTTSAAVCDEAGRVRANLKSPLPVAEGNRGLRQSDALFAHTKNLPELCDRLAAVLRDEDLTPIAVGCSAKPRDAEGSYMPCFLAGIAAAHSFAAARGLPVFDFSHQDGHIMAAYCSSGAEIEGDFAAFHVSGGTTEVLFVRQTDTGFSPELIGGTNDLNAGQAVDRVGVMMGMRFPAGPELDLTALGYTGRVPKPAVSVDGLYCNLSGLENIAAKFWRDTGDRALVSAVTLDFVARTISGITKNLRAEYAGIPVIYAGGVMSSRYIKEKLKGENIFFAEPGFSADNAAGISLLCRRLFGKGTDGNRA